MYSSYARFLQEKTSLAKSKKFAILPPIFLKIKVKKICEQKNHDLRNFFATYNLRGKTAEVLSAKNCERSEQTAGVLAQAPEGSVSTSLI